jgi:hypothetical protein
MTPTQFLQITILAGTLVAAGVAFAITRKL